MPKPLSKLLLSILNPCSCSAKYFYAVKKVLKDVEEIRRNYHHGILAHVLQPTETKACTLKSPSAFVTEGCEAAASLREPMPVCHCRQGSTAPHAHSYQ